MLEIEENTQYGLARKAIANVVEVDDNIVIPCENNFGICFLIKQNMWWQKLSPMLTKIPITKEILPFEGTTMICCD